MKKLRWELVHRDLFDRDTPLTVDEVGKGRLEGLEALWEKVLLEGIVADGRRSFSEFSLKLEGDPIRITVPMLPTGVNDSLVRMREWVENDRSALKQIAVHHAAWLTAYDHEGTAKLLECVKTADLPEDLECNW